MNGSVLVTLMFVVVIVVLIAWLLAIKLFIDAAKEKGYYRDGGAGILWFIGIFATPIVVGLYTSSLPNKRLDASPMQKMEQDELPSI